MHLCFSLSYLSVCLLLPPLWQLLLCMQCHLQRWLYLYCCFDLGCLMGQHYRIRRLFWIEGILGLHHIGSLVVERYSHWRLAWCIGFQSYFISSLYIPWKYHVYTCCILDGLGLCLEICFLYLGIVCRWLSFCPSLCGSCIWYSGGSLLFFWPA